MGFRVDFMAGLKEAEGPWFAECWQKALGIESLLLECCCEGICWLKVGNLPSGFGGLDGVEDVKVDCVADFDWERQEGRFKSHVNNDIRG